jgi:hypothetical protein
LFFRFLRTSVRQVAAYAEERAESPYAGRFGTAFEQPLHPEADPEEGRATIESRLDRYTPLVTQRTRRGEVADPWNDDATDLCELRRDDRRSHVSPNRGKCLAD